MRLRLSADSQRLGIIVNRHYASPEEVSDERRNHAVVAPFVSCGVLPEHSPGKSCDMFRRLSRVGQYLNRHFGRMF